ncbi:MAG: glycosyltransferase family 4 protein [Candidatus Aminicenantes bacterium]|nr:glycosyltransferase family 4 protein [Candidatus Aminicenantes bacterium]
MAKILPARGHRVRWILQSDSPLREPRKVRWHGSDVFLLPSKTRNSLPEKVLDWIPRAFNTIRCFNRLVKIERPDIIQIRNDWISGLWALRIRRKYGIPFVFQYSRPGPGYHLQRAQKASLTSRLGLIFRGRLENRLVHRILRQADHVLPISEWMKEALAAWGIPDDRMTPFPLGFNIDVSPDKVSGSRIREKYGLGRVPVVLYFGELARFRKLDFLLRTIKLVIQKIPQTKLLIVGGSERSGDVASLKKEAEELGLKDQVIFTGKVPREEIPEYIVASDVGVSPIPPIPIYWISSPTKLIETMGMARAAVANDIPEQKAVLEESGAGLCVPYEEQAFAEAILSLLRSPELARKMGLKGRRYVENKRSYQDMAGKLENIYLSLVSR